MNTEQVLVPAQIPGYARQTVGSINSINNIKDNSVSNNSKNSSSKSNSMSRHDPDIVDLCDVDDDSAEVVIRHWIEGRGDPVKFKYIMKRSGTLQLLRMVKKR